MASDAAPCDYSSVKTFLTTKRNDPCTVCWESKCEVICINCGCSSHLQCLTKWLEKKQSSYLSYGKSSSGGCPVCRKKININIKIDTNRVCNDQVDDESPVQSPWPAERGCVLIRWITRLLTCALVFFAVFWSLIILFALQERYEFYQNNKNNPYTNQNPIEAVANDKRYCGLLNRLFKNCA